MPIKMVVGLGNPGKKYEGTRHNIGRRVVEGLSEISSFLPVSFMNESGRDVAHEAKRNGISPAEILVVLDEFQIPLRQVKILKSGSDGGHNGLKSILEYLGTENVPRMRIGIGPLRQGDDPADFVLEKFTSQERKILDVILPHLEDAIATTVTQGIDASMNKYNNRLLA
jgi:PTH1 family peptidyl-tRNA hydrolase